MAETTTLTRLLGRAIVCGTACVIGLSAAQAEDAAPLRLQAFPPRIQLDSGLDHQAVIAQAVDEQALTTDVTDQAELSIADERVARITGNIVHPVADGETQLTVRYAGATQVLPVQVRQSAHFPAPSFRRDIQPAFARAGCSRGACHGSPQGRDGFRLSFQGFDPALDLYRLISEQPGRRVNLTVVDDSLILRKALGEVPHGGGTLLTRNSELHLLIRRWLEAGAPDDPLPDLKPGESEAERSTTASLHPAALEIYPPTANLAAGGGQQRFIVVSRFRDGSDADVTSLARFKSSLEPTAPVTAEGLVVAGDPGLAMVSAAFGTLIVGSPVYSVPASQPQLPANETAGNYIDQAISAHAQKLRLALAPAATEETFLRRIYLDLTGRLPTIDEQDAFLQSSQPDRREQLIDRLLASEEFADLWTLTWADLLQMRSHPQLGVSFKGTKKYHAWLRQQIVQNRPIDALVREMLTASGPGFEAPATHFFLYESDPLNLAENVAQSMLGLRMKCAKCHNHPFDVWTMDDYYGFAAFFGRIERKKGGDPREKIVSSLMTGEVENPLTKRPAVPRFLGGGVAPVGENDRREVLAQWLTSHENPFFARMWANRIWSHFFGAGLVDPIDDARFSNPASIPSLLDALEQALIAAKFDTRTLMRDICLSQAYQRASTAETATPAAERSLAIFPVRRLRAEVLLDCLSQATETAEPLTREALGARAVTLVDGSTTNFFLSTFGRSTHRTVCACEVKSEPTLSQALHLLNGAAVHGKIAEGDLIGRRIAAGQSDDEIIREFYRRALCREPSPSDWEDARAVLAEVDDRQAALEDFFWTLLNSHEFLFVY